MNNKVKNVLLVVLVIGLIGMTTAYALLSQNLNIQTTAKVKGSSWDVHFEELTDGQLAVAGPNTNVQTARVVTQPTLGTTLISGLDAEFKNPGDYVTYDFYIVNDGNIDAQISDYVLNTSANGFVCTDSEDSTSSTEATNVCGNMDFKVTYIDATTAAQTGTVIAAGTEIAEGQILKANQQVKVRLTAQFKDTDNSSILPSNDVTISGLNAVITYQQY